MKFRISTAVLFFCTLLTGGGTALGVDPPERATVRRVARTVADALRVVDSNGNVLGSVLGAQTVSTVLGDVPFLLEVDSSGIKESTQSFAFFYVTTDCSGQPYGRPNPTPLFAEHLVVNKSIYYVPAAEDTSTVFSFRQFDQSGPRPCELLALGYPGYAPYQAIRLDFTPPFRVVP